MTLQQDKYQKFRVLLDEPASQPALGFDDYAEAFADIVVASKPQFAIGIFGDWGAGKTTLMRALEAALTRPDGADRMTIIPVWFNAWRYEREEHLIVPLLDTVREGLATWAAKAGPSDQARHDVRKAASIVGKAARALAAGLSMKATLAPIDISFDPGKALSTWTDSAAADEPLSFYHSTFGQLKEAIADVTKDDRRRIVIFIDDLDRCLPLNALEVLESMKLFFDLEGFVFVVGLDQGVIERSIEMKYQSAAPAQGQADVLADVVRWSQSNRNGPSSPTGSEVVPEAPGRRSAPISGADYVKKLFQVPFTLPRISTDDLETFFDSIVNGAGLPPEQRDDLRDVMKRHLRTATGADAGSVNPREVKRLINAYTVQMKILSAKLAEPDPNIVVALQSMAFRPDWRDLYDILVSAPDVFVAAVREVRDDESGQIDFALRNEPLPARFLDYVRGPAASLLSGVSLEPYITSAESVGSTNPGLAEARMIVFRLRRTLAQMEAGAITHTQALDDLHAKVPRLYEAVDRTTVDSSPYGAEAFRWARVLQAESKNLPKAGPGATGPAAWLPRVRELIENIDRNLAEVRRETRVSATA